MKTQKNNTKENVEKFLNELEALSSEELYAKVKTYEEKFSKNPFKELLKK